MDDALLNAARKRIEAVVIGASAGGIDALLTIFGGLRQGFRLPIVVVLHLRATATPSAPAGR